MSNKWEAALEKQIAVKEYELKKIRLSTAIKSLDGPPETHVPIAKIKEFELDVLKARLAADRYLDHPAPSLQEVMHRPGDENIPKFLLPVFYNARLDGEDPLPHDRRDALTRATEDAWRAQNVGDVVITPLQATEISGEPTPPPAEPPRNNDNPKRSAFEEAFMKLVDR